jgi:hypothetical protein
MRFECEGLSSFHVKGKRMSKDNGYNNPYTVTSTLREKDESNEYVIVSGHAIDRHRFTGYKVQELPENTVHEPLLVPKEIDLEKYGEWSKFRYALGPQIRRQLKAEGKRTDSATAIVAVYSVIFSYCQLSAREHTKQRNEEENEKPKKRGCYAATQTIADKAAASWRVAHNSIKWLVSRGYVHDETPDLLHEPHTLRVVHGLYLLEAANKQYQTDKGNRVYRRKRIRQV